MSAHSGECHSHNSRMSNQILHYENCYFVAACVDISRSTARQNKPMGQQDSITLFSIRCQWKPTSTNIMWIRQCEKKTPLWIVGFPNVTRIPNAFHISTKNQAFRSLNNSDCMWMSINLRVKMDWIQTISTTSIQTSNSLKMVGINETITEFNCDTALETECDDLQKRCDFIVQSSSFFKRRTIPFQIVSLKW
jgi:hypothetical protein